MAFALKDVRLTTRRVRGAGEGDLPALYPRLLRDKSVLPKVNIAIGYFDSMVGTERRELEPELLVQFFGDHKLARCMVGCLARSYRYRSPSLAEVVTPAARRRLLKKGIASPEQLRLTLFDRVNREGDGFLRLVEREPELARMEKSLGLRARELERLLFLDAEEHAMLVRYGDAPRAEDTVAQFNFGVLDTLLRQAEQVDLAIGGLASEGMDAIHRLCAQNEVDAEIKTGSRATLLRLRGRQDAMGLWSRHGKRLVRTIVQIVENSGPQILDAAACVALRAKRAILRLTPEALEMLGNRGAEAGWGTPRVNAETVDPRRLTVDISPSTPRLPGWIMRRRPEIQAWESGVIVPDLALESAQGRLYVAGIRSLAHGERLAGIFKGVGTPQAYIFAGEPAALAKLNAAGARTIPQVETDLDLRGVVGVAPDAINVVTGKRSSKGKVA
jgi:predicted nuclease of restriction endonuclease-like RecB superfamily